MPSIDSLLTILKLDPVQNLALIPAARLQDAHVPPFPPDMAALILNLDTPRLAEAVQAALLAVYPANWPIRLVSRGQVAEIPLSDLPNAVLDAALDAAIEPALDDGAALYIPALGEGTSLEAFHEVVAHLRAPDGCPWDRKQTHASLRPYLLEETYEALAALDAAQSDKMAEEFGDLLLQIVLHAQIASEAGTFRLADILQGVTSKIIRRHPHVFGDVQVDGVGGVLVNWERLKAEERAANGEAEKGMLDSVPGALPALSQAHQYADRAARVGFDWETIDPVRQKVLEELDEIADAPDAVHQAMEIGDLLFAVVNLARWYHVDAETALRETNQRFRRRFQYIEKCARQAGRPLNSMTLAEMDVWWEEAKALE
ncbi:MAG TPA: nucleoside triphosphate pyrophosphohydrolase [Anaerolineaceae bacterium]|nr:nucleoside triphosphate pyrophosphohydrolase [Anaerolineaceae bacterium]